MGLIDQHQIPGPRTEHAGVAALMIFAEGMEGGHNCGMVFPKMTVWLIQCGIVNRGPEVEHLPQPNRPLFGQTRGAKHKEAALTLMGEGRHKDEARLNRLPQPDIISHQPAGRPGFCHLAADPKLVGKQLDPGKRENPPLPIE